MINNNSNNNRRSAINTPVWGKHFRYRTRRRKNSFCCPSRIQQKLKLQRFSAPMQARAATSKAARPNRIQQARFDAYGNQWLAIAGVCPIPNVLNKNQFFCKKFGYGRIRRALFERQNLHPGEFCKGNWGFGNRLPENCDFT